MSSPKYPWWNPIRNAVKAFPPDLATPPLTKGDERLRDCIAQAAEEVREWPDGAEALELLRLVFWTKPPQTIANAAASLGMDTKTARAHCHAFIMLVGELMQLI